MPKRITPLIDLEIRRAKAKDKAYKLSDGDGMYLFITPSGGKLWRMDYRFQGMNKTISFGSYPEISLDTARRMRLDTRQLLINGTDPCSIKKETAIKQNIAHSNTFASVALEWHEAFKATWVEKHADTKLKRLNYVIAELGNVPISHIEAQQLFTVIKGISVRHSLGVAHQTRNDCVQVFRYAIATGKTQRNIAMDLQGALPPVQEKHFAAPTTPEALASVLKAINGYDGYYPVQVALRLAPMLLCRPGELRGMEWSELDLDKAEWNIPANRMKMKIAHLVPLSKQAVELLVSLKQHTGHSKYCFPSVRTPQRIISDNTINAALRRLGMTSEEIVGHGFRASARTIMDEVLGMRVDLIEHQLAHAVRDTNGRAYNRTSHIEARKEMMQEWADYLANISV